MAEIQDGDVLVSSRGVQKSYNGETLIMKDFNLDTRKSESLTLLDLPGSGKTTSPMMLAGFETPATGEILLAGRSINNVPPRKRDIGMVFQSYALLPHITVAEDLAFSLSVRGMDKIDVKEKVKRALSTTQLDAFVGRYPAQLFGGQQQRVALVRALVFELQLVLMDGPLGALDEQLREHTQMEVKHLHQCLDVIVVYVTHDQGEALTMSNRVAAFRQGEIQQIKPPRNLYEQPHDTFVANFIGENSRLSGQFLSCDGERCVVGLSCGEKVEASAVNIDQPDEPTTLSIRSEWARLNGASESCVNRFPDRATEFVYLGDHVCVRLEACDRDDFFVKQPIAEPDSTLSAGDVVPSGWQVEHVRAFDPLSVV